MIGNIFRIERYAVHDGPGIRTTVFLKGCPLRCWWCHSPESQASEPELMYRPERCIRCFKCVEACQEGAVSMAGDSIVIDQALCRWCGSCADVCAAGARVRTGRAMSAADVVSLVDRDTLFYDQSGGGVTFSGGEPFVQPQFLLEMLEGCRRRRIHTAVDTCGMADREMLLASVGLVNLFLFDIKILDEERHRLFTGVSNRKILQNLAALVEARANVWIRIPLVPGVNDDPAHLQHVGRLLADLRLSRVDVLPYHRAGTAKYPALGREYRLSGAAPVAEAGEAVRILSGFGLDAVAGGRP